MRNALGMFGAGVAFIIMIVFMFIYGMALDGILIAVGISAVIAGGFMIDGVIVRKHKIEKLQSISRVGMFTMEMPPIDQLPEITDDIDKNYQEVIRLLYMDHMHMVGQIERRKTETKEYYAEWERRIKVHISAIENDLIDKGVRESDPLRENLRSLERYVETALCYIEIQNGRIKPVLANQSVDRTLERVIERLKEKIANGNVLFTYKPIGLFVKTDERLLTIALEDLITTIIDRVSGGSIEITGEVEGNKVMLLIKAKPVGDNRHELARMFERGLNQLSADIQRADGNELNVCREIFSALRYKNEVLRGYGVSTLKIDMGFAPQKVDLWKPPE